jgi:hypothetical protein
MRTRGFQTSSRFALAATLALVWGLVPAGNGVRPVSAAQVQAIPEDPEDLEAFAADRDPIKIGLTWDDKSDNEDKFEVERRIYQSGNEFQKIGETGPNQTEFIDGNIRNNIQYEYRVRAVNQDGASDYTNSAIAFFGTPGKVKVQPNKIDYGNVRPGATRSRKFTIRNTGRSTITVTVAMVGEGGPFTITDNGGEFDMEPGTSVRVTVQYTPTEVGRDSGQVSVKMSDVELRVKLRGRAVEGRRG